MIKRIVQEISNRISSENENGITDKQKYYISGLADALEIIKKYSSEYVANNYYYVVMPQNKYSNSGNRIARMKLKSIHSRNNNNYYCFKGHYLDGEYDSVTLTLSCYGSLKTRVFKTKEEAQRNKDFVKIR